MEKSLQRIQATVVDGRSRTPRYIQKQLTVLHDVLVREASSFQNAIVQDTACSASEAWFEIHVTLKAVKEQFRSINFKDFLKDEYSLAKGHDAPNRRVACGCAYIIPSKHSRFYSIVQPTAAAMAAGNCVVVEMQKTLLEVDRIFKQAMTQTMDSDMFAIVEQRPQSDKFFTEHVVVANDISNVQTFDTFSAKTLVSSPRRAVTVVDRSANISEAAKHIVRARFRFGGKSPYAPDVVLVNEFALKEFCQAAVRFLTEGVSEAVTMNGTSKPQQPSPGNALSRDLQQAGTVTLVSGARGSIHLLKQRADSILSRKISEPVLVVHAISSLDDAIDTANTDTPLLATYFFADPAATKYLSQFIRSDISFANHIPPQLLIGPAAPQDFSVSVASRYTKDMFSAASPEYIQPTSDDAILIEFLDSPASKTNIAKIKAEIQTPLPDMGEPTTTTVGFFEQGILTGLAINSTILFGSIGVCAWYGVPALLRIVRR